MTAQDVTAARARVTQRETELAEAKRSLAVLEHGEYRQALQLIAQAIKPVPEQITDTNGMQAANPALDAVRTVLSGLGFRA